MRQIYFLTTYIYSIKLKGASHFDIAESQAREIVTAMLAELPGFLVPKLVREIGGEKSKTPNDLRAC